MAASQQSKSSSHLTLSGKQIASVGVAGLHYLQHVRGRPEGTQAHLMAPTRPSIMSEGDTVSAPARAWLTA